MGWGDDTQTETQTDAPERDPYYCPGCGKGYLYPAECKGTPVAPHPAIQTVTSDELDKGEEHHTPAPPSDLAA